MVLLISAYQKKVITFRTEQKMGYFCCATGEKTELPHFSLMCWHLILNCVLPNHCLIFFLYSCSIETAEDMLKMGVYVNDLNLHDSSTADFGLNTAISRAAAGPGSGEENTQNAHSFERGRESTLCQQSWLFFNSENRTILHFKGSLR